MELTNKKLIKMLEKARLYELEFRIEEIDDTSDMEEEGMTEPEYILREVQWLIEDYNDDGCLIHEDLLSARQLLRETDNGKRIPTDLGFRPLQGYSKYDIEQARNLVNEYRRTKRFCEKLEKMVEGGKI